MDKRYQIFVSSTYEDLKHERNKVITALLSLGHIPCGMEYFPAADEDAWHCIERLIPQCDYYVLLLAGKYGSIPTGDTVSYTEKEYDLAVSSGVPVISLLHASPEDIPKKLCESDKKIQVKLDRFRGKAKRRLCRFWKTADQIPGELLASIAHQIARTPRTGWVRADVLASEEAKSEIIGLRKKLDGAEARIKKLEKARIDQEGELASGGDELRLGGTIQNYEPNAWLDEPEPANPLTARIEVVSTWDRFLGFLANCHKKSFSSRELREWIERSVSETTEIKSLRVDGEDWQSVWALIEPEEIDKITTQLCALNIVSLRKTFSDWSFTQKGLFHCSRQKALKKGEIYSGQSPWCHVVIGERKTGSGPMTLQKIINRYRSNPDEED